VFLLQLIFVAISSKAENCVDIGFFREGKLANALYWQRQNNEMKYFTPAISLYLFCILNL